MRVYVSGKTLKGWFRPSLSTVVNWETSGLQRGFPAKWSQLTVFYCLPYGRYNLR